MAGMDDYEPIIQEAAQKYGVDPNVLRKLVLTESAGQPDATSPKGAQGLTQLMPHTAQALGVTDPMDPRQNIMGGANYFSQMLKQFTDPRKAAAAYNFGPTNVAAGKDYPKETQDFINRVLGPEAGPTDVKPPNEFAPFSTDPLDKTKGGPSLPANAGAPPPVQTALGAPNPQPAPPPGPPPTGALTADGPGFMDRAKGMFSRAMDSLTGPAPVQAAAPSPAPPAAAAIAKPPNMAAGGAGVNAPVTPTVPPPVDIPSPVNPFEDARADPGKFLGRDSNPRNPPAMAERAMRQPGARVDPIQMLVDHLKQAPNPKDYRGNFGTKLLAGVAGGLSAAASDDPGSGLEKTQKLLGRNYDRALETYKARGEGIGQVAKYTDAADDRARLDREETAREKYWQSQADSNRERADKYGTLGRNKTGAQKPVPVGQQNEAWQNAAERIYASDPDAKKFIHREVGKNGPFYWIEPEMNRSYMWNRDFTDKEREAQQKLLERIDKEASSFTHTMVDPYDRSGFNAPKE